jgi:hypothetical protein
MMKDILNKLAQLEASAPKATKKKMLKEDSTTAPINVSNKPASLKDVFESIAGMKPIPVVGKEGGTQSTAAGFVNVTDPALQGLGKTIGDLAAQKKIQLVVPTQPGQAPAAGQQPVATAPGQPAQAGATGQPLAGQMQMKEKDEGKPGKNFAKIAKSAGERYGSKAAGERVAGAVRAKLAKQGKLEEVDMDEGMLSKAALGLAGAAALAGGAHAASPGKTRIDPVNPHATVTKVNPTAATPVKINPVNKFGKVTRVDPTAATPTKINPVNKRSEPVRIDNLDNPRSKPVRVDLEEKLTKSMSAGDIISDFEKSKDPKFKGKSKEERKKQALGAYYSMHPEKSKKKTDEGDIPSSSGVDTKGAGLGAGRSMTTLEAKEPQVEVIDNAFNRENYKDLIGKKYPKSKAPAYARVKEISEGAKPDFLDLDKDGNKKEPMSKAAADKKKQKVKESMNHRISAARLEGKSHGLRGHAHSGKRYEDLDEIRAYHEGYKEGLDECYGQGVYETAPAMPAATVPGMADAAMDEGNAFTAALAKTPKGGKFEVGGKTFTDRSSIEEYAFESWDKELNDLLNEGTDVNEGMTVSISKGQQGSPDSVSISAQDADAEQLLAFVKNAGLGLFGDDHAEPSSAMSVQPSHGAPDEIGAGGVDIDVVDGHDGMMGLMQKLSGVEASGSEDYADEEGDYADEESGCGCEEGSCGCDDYDQPTNEDTCNECGMMEAQCGCSKDKEIVDEVESEDQMEFEVAEDNAPDTETAEHTADEDAEAAEDAALAQAAQQNKTNTVNEGGDGGEASEEGTESKEGETDEEGETVSESFTNLFRKLAFIAEESTEKEDDKAEKAGEKVTKDIEHDDKEDKKGMSDKQAKFFGKKADKEKVDEWANQVGKGEGKGTDASFEQDIDFMTKVIAGGLNKPKSTGQTTTPVIAGQDTRMHDNPLDWATLAGIKK